MIVKKLICYLVVLPLVASLPLPHNVAKTKVDVHRSKAHQPLNYYIPAIPINSNGYIPAVPTGRNGYIPAITIDAVANPPLKVAPTGLANPPLKVDPPGVANPPLRVGPNHIANPPIVYNNRRVG